MYAPHIANIDLNLLRVFDAVYDEGSVTRAGARLGLTQSAVSHALNRLRYILGDDLFLRGPRGIRPTVRAQAIGPQVRQALEQLHSALSVDDFEPAVSERQFTFAAAAYVCAVLAPILVNRVGGIAPNVGLHFIEAPPDLAHNLDAGGVDFAVGVFERAPPRFALDPLMGEDLVWVIRRDHPLADRLKSLEDLIQVPSVVIRNPASASARSLGLDPVVSRPGWEDADRIETALAERGLRRRIGVTVSDTASAIAVVARSDMAAIVPRRMAQVGEEGGRLRTLVPSDATRQAQIEVQLVYRRDRLADPATAWMRDQILAASRTI
jgi:DNA-binding transcriptional LysR family regulator